MNRNGGKNKKIYCIKNFKSLFFKYGYCQPCFLIATLMNPQPCLSAEFLFVFSFDGEQLTSSWSYTIDFIYFEINSLKNYLLCREGGDIVLFITPVPKVL